MKILGIGVDIIENKRLRKLILNKNFVNRIFTNKEINRSKKIRDKTNYFAKRFAAKESLVKALGTGFRDRLNFKDIEILNDKKGKPFYSKNAKINNIINSKFKEKKYNIFLSISDENKYSIAYTILQKK
tara:strand:- start:259 stop:645 length:387 start_codon:yes stop_codon:yes gene_type:complete